jgi:hypothetical protein
MGCWNPPHAADGAFHPQIKPLRNPRHRGAGDVAVDRLMVADNTRQDLPVFRAGLLPIHQAPF